MISSLTQSVIIESWKNMIPREVFVSAGTLESDFPSLTPKELISVGVVTGIRMRELEAGRMHARYALEEMGIYNVDIPKNKLNGSPVWPTQIIGSITHSVNTNNSHVCTAVASAKQFDFFGIDAEWCDQIYPNTWGQFLTLKELDWVTSTPMADRSKLVCKIWTLKEAVIKAMGKGDMMNWEVSSSSKAEIFKLSSVALNEVNELDGRAICREGLALAVVYKYAN